MDQHNSTFNSTFRGYLLNLALALSDDAARLIQVFADCLETSGIRVRGAVGYFLLRFSTHRTTP